MDAKILFVDDDVNLLDAIQRAVRKQFSIDTAIGGAEGLRKLASDGPYAVIVSDMQMPEMSGLEFLRNVQTQAPDAVRMMLTGNADQKTAMDAVNDGRVFRFLTKPCTPATLAPALDAALEQSRLVRAERELLENTLGGAVKVLTEILARFDPITFDRAQKLKEYARDFVQNSNDKASWELELAAMLSQIGRVTVPPEVLEKIRNDISPTPQEKDLLRQVPEFGARLIENIPRLGAVANIVRYQKKHFDGSGFPTDALAGNDIPIGARILHVLTDLLDAEARSVSRPTAFQQMQERVGFYDLNVLSSISCWCDVALGEVPGIRQNPPQALRLDELRTGHILAQDLRTAEGMLLVAAETKLTSMLLVTLMNFRALKTIDNTVLVHVGDAPPIH